MPHVGRVKDEEGAKCPFAKQQSPTEEKQERTGDKTDRDYPPGMVTFATNNKDEVRFLQELGFQLVDISQPIASPAGGDDKEVKVGELGGLSLNLIIPGVSEPVHVVVTGTELVQELRQFSVERNESCYRTCVGLYHNGAKMEEFVEVGSIEGIKNGSVIKFEEEPYSLRDARIHVCRIKEILMDNIDILCSGNEGMSFSFLSHITVTNPEEDVKAASGEAAATPTKEAVQPPNYCLPSARNAAPPISAFYPHGYHTKPPDSLKELYYNKWNPPSSQRKLKGDLLYLTVHTLEGQEYGITSCYSGFYVNKCSGNQMFDPNPAKLSHHSHHLIGLLSQVSPLFKKNFALLQKQG